MSNDLLGLDWDHVRVFLAVARAGQLAGAARRLDMDVSTVSRRLDRAEEVLGVHLFDRGRTGARMTAVAEIMLPAAEAAERAMADVLGAAGAAETAAEGVVRVTAPPGLVESFVAPLIARLHETHPKVTVELEARVGYADLTRREADIAVRTVRPKSGDLVVKKLVSTRVVPMAAPRYVRQLGRLSRIGDARWIVWDRALEHLPAAQWILTRLEAPPVLRTSHFASQLSAAEAGAGVVLAPEPFCLVRALEPVVPGRRLRGDWKALPEEQLWIVGHRTLRDVPRVAVVWEVLAETLSQPERAGELFSAQPPFSDSWGPS